MKRGAVNRLKGMFDKYLSIEKKMTNQELLMDFKRDYKKAMEKALAYNGKINLDSKMYQELKEILKKKNFILNIQNIRLINKNEVFFEASLENDYIKTLKYVNSVEINKRSALVIEYFKKNNINYSLLPTSTIHSSNDDIIASKELEFMRNNVESSIAYYHPDIEKELLMILKSDCKSIEEYLCSIKDLKREELSINQVYSLGFYLRKLLSKNHLSLYKIDLFSYSASEKYGSQQEGYTSNKISVYNGNIGVDVSRIVHTLHHEFIHALQNQQLKDLAIEQDKDLDFYLEDRLLIKYFDLGYIVNNYFRISYEYDADCKAYLLDKYLFNHDNSKGNDDYLKDSNRFKEDFYRESRHHLATLDQVFVKSLNAKDKHGHALSNETQQNPLLRCKFGFDSTRDKYILKDIDTLKSDYLNCKDQTEKKIYYNLLKRNLLVSNKKAFLDERRAYLDVIKYQEFIENLKKR